MEKYEDEKRLENKPEKKICYVEVLPVRNVNGEIGKLIEDFLTRKVPEEKVKRWLGKTVCPFEDDKHHVDWRCNLYFSCIECLVDRANELGEKSSFLQTLFTFDEI